MGWGEVIKAVLTVITSWILDRFESDREIKKIRKEIRSDLTKELKGNRNPYRLNALSNELRNL